MSDQNTSYKISVIILLLGGILALHYLTLPVFRYQQAVYRMLFYIPLILGSFWFGMKGAVSICVTAILSYAPYVILRWQKATSFEDFSIILEGLLFIALSLLLGYMVEREKRLSRSLVRNENLAAMGVR